MYSATASLLSFCCVAPKEPLWGTLVPPRHCSASIPHKDAQHKYKRCNAYLCALAPFEENYIMHSCIIYVMGVSGSGKTTVGKKLAQKMGLPFFDADDFHSAANKQKMTAGVPLTDEDRQAWLNKMNQAAREQAKLSGAVFGCSALKERYRAVLSSGIMIPLYWVFLQGSFELIKKRMEERKDHFMPPDLLSSQFADLEIPDKSITIDITKTPDEIVDSIISQLR